MSFLEKEWKKMAPDNGGGNGNTPTTLDKVVIYNGQILCTEDNNNILKPLKIQYLPKLQDKTHALNNQSETLNVSAAQAAGYEGYGDITINAKTGICENDVVLNNLVYDNVTHEIIATAYGKTKDSFSAGWIGTKPTNSISQSKSIDLDTILTATKTITANGITNVVGYKEVDVNVSGGSTPVDVERKDVNFYDYNGTRIFSYTAADFANLNAMPTNPGGTGLIADGWNWTLQQAKTHVSNNGELDIGALYIPNTNADIEVDIEVPEERKELALYLNVTGDTVYNVDWGDGNNLDYQGSGVEVRASLPHIYSSGGNYTIKLTIKNSTLSSPYFLLTNPHSYSSYNGLIGKRVVDYQLQNLVYMNMIKRIRLKQHCHIGAYAFGLYTGLKQIIISKNVEIESVDHTFYNCESLQNLILPTSFYFINSSSGGYFCYGCRTLKLVLLPYMQTTSIEFPQHNEFTSIEYINNLNNVQKIGAYGLSQCNYLKKIIIPNTITRLSPYVFADSCGLKEIHFKSTTPPIVESSTAFMKLPFDCTIYVPSAAISDYLSATNYPPGARIIEGEVPPEGKYGYIGE